jgi:N-acetylglucosaminyldiphosphoundecaprenol N-acetyl-beta-D-mannosaminyltransferase
MSKIDLELAMGILTHDAYLKNQQALDVLLENPLVNGWLLTLNSDILRQLSLKENFGIRKLILNRALLTIDGAPIKYILEKTSRNDSVEVLTGNHLWMQLMHYCSINSRPFVFAGGSASTQQACMDKVKASNSNFVFVCADIPVSQDPSTLALEEVLKNHANAVVMVGIGALKQERLIAKLVDKFPEALFVGCGAAGNFYGELTQRAPRYLQISGFEWLYRLAKEPRRLFRRYILEDAPFLLMLLARVLSGERK